MTVLISAGASFKANLIHFLLEWTENVAQGGDILENLTAGSLVTNGCRIFMHWIPFVHGVVIVDIVTSRLWRSWLPINHID